MQLCVGTKEMYEGNSPFPTSLHLYSITIGDFQSMTKTFPVAKSLLNEALDRSDCCQFQ